MVYGDAEAVRDVNIEERWEARVQVPWWVYLLAAVALLAVGISVGVRERAAG